MFRKHILALNFLLALCSICPPALAQTSLAGWAQLGTYTLDLRTGQHTIQLPTNVERPGSRAIKLVATNGTLALSRITVTYANGQIAYEDEPPALARGGETRELAEREDALVIDSIAFNYTAQASGGTVTVEVWSLPPQPLPRSAVTGPVDQKGYRELAVLFGTTRRREGYDRVKNNRALATFSGTDGGALTYGRAIVTIPIEREVGSLPRPEFNFIFIRAALRGEDPKRDFTIAAVDVTSEGQFIASMRGQAQRAERFKSQALVFVHGYNVSFDDAIFRTAQIAHDIGFDGPAITFSWASRGSAWAYRHDVDAAKGSRTALRTLLERVAADPAITSVNLVAHSMGNDPVTEVLGALADIKRAGGTTQDLKLNEIVLAAPDVSRTVFEELTGKISGKARGGITLYASAADRALLLSKKVAGDLVRAGDVPAGGPVVVRGMETIDVTRAGTSFFSTNHTTFADREDLVDDMRALLTASRRPPNARWPALAPVGSGSGLWWRYGG